MTTTTQVREREAGATIARIRDMICNPDSVHDVLRRVHYCYAAGRTWAVATDGRILIAVDAPAGGFPPVPWESADHVARIIEAGGERLDVDGAAFRAWVGPVDSPLAYWWNIRAGRIGGALFDQNLIAYGLTLVPGTATALYRWSYHGVHLLTIDGDGWRISLAGIRRRPEYDDAPEWEATAHA